MVDITFVDHVESGLSLLPSQWDDKPVIRGILEAWLSPLNESEQCALDVRDGFNVNTAVGAQLDIIGDYYDETRKGRTDTEYRAAILSIIAASNGSGTPNDVIDLFKALSSGENVKYWEHYPLSFMMYSEFSDQPILSAGPNIQRASPAGVEFAALMYDPDGFAWIGKEAVSGFANLVTNTGDQLVDNLGNEFIVSAIFEDVDDGTFRSSFVDESVDGDSFGYGQNYGLGYGGVQAEHSIFCDSVFVDNELVVSGGNGFIEWAGMEEVDPETGTTNKYKPIPQYQDSGIKRGQPVPRQFFNWMMAKIDDWFAHIGNRTVVGSIRITADPSQTITDYANRFGGTWQFNGTQDWTVSNETTYIFERTA